MSQGRCYPNLIGVFAKAFPLQTGAVAGRVASRFVTYHGATYKVVGDPDQTGEYAFDVYLMEDYR